MDVDEKADLTAFGAFSLSPGDEKSGFAPPDHGQNAAKYAIPNPNPNPNPLEPEPFPLIHSTGFEAFPGLERGHYALHNARLMALTHNTVFRALNSIYDHAALICPSSSSCSSPSPSPSPSSSSDDSSKDTQDVRDFCTYIEIAVSFLQIHHETEEEIYFPAIEAAVGMPGCMAANVREHAEFDDSLKALSGFARAGLAATAKSAGGRLGPKAEGDEKEWAYDGMKLLVILEELREPLVRHMHAEIPSILGLWDKIGSGELKGIYKRMHDEAERKSDGFKAGPFVLSHQSSTFRLDGLSPAQLPFPEVPGIAKYVVHYCMAWRYRGVWRFSPSDCFGAHNSGKYRPRVRESFEHGRKDEGGNVGLNESGNENGMLMSWKRAVAMIVLMLGSVVLAFLLMAVLEMLEVAFKARNL